MLELLLVIMWLVCGYAFTYWFVNDFLDDQRWSDTGQKPGVLNLIMLTIAGPFMAFIMGMGCVFWLLGWIFGPGFKKLYGIKD